MKSAKIASPPSWAFFATSSCSSLSSVCVISVLSFHCVGRCIGVTLLLAQTPWRSGFPSAVRGTLYDGSTPYLAPGSWAGDCAMIETAATDNATRTAPAVLMDPPDNQESVVGSQESEIRQSASLNGIGTSGH